MYSCVLYHLLYISAHMDWYDAMEEQPEPCKFHFIMFKFPNYICIKYIMSRICAIFGCKSRLCLFVDTQQLNQVQMGNGLQVPTESGRFSILSAITYTYMFTENMFTI